MVWKNTDLAGRVSLPVSIVLLKAIHNECMERETWFADVILPLAVPKPFTYRVPAKWNNAVCCGQRAVVQFGKRKYYTGVIQNLHRNAPRYYEAKYLGELLDEHPIVTPQQLKHWEWLSDYYMCTLGEVYAAAVPSSLKVASETRIVLAEGFEQSNVVLTAHEQDVVEALGVRESMSVKEMGELLGIQTVQPIVKSLLEHGAIALEEELKERYKPRTEEFVMLAPAYHEEDTLRQAFDELEKAPRQLEMLMTYVQMSRLFETGPEAVRKTVLQRKAGATSATTNKLAEKGIFLIEEREVGRLPVMRGMGEVVAELTAHQQEAFESVKEQWREKHVVLLHGITSSGKTELYMELMSQAAETGKQVLYLLPEIALTAQMITRLQKRFGNSIAVYHSRLSNSERAEIWLRLCDEDSEIKLILGARSALLLPFSNLGLVVVDEEHENTFKQFDPNPRYHARDAATVLASIHDARVLLGSATPSVESYWLAKTGKYGLVELSERFGGVALPDIELVKMEKGKKGANSLFSPTLISSIKQRLEAGEQVILFQNRRGYSPMWICGTCGWVPQCEQCDVSTTYHKWKHQLICHYCGRRYEPPTVCKACGSRDIKMIGFGTEKVEEELALELPDARIGRLDLDTARSKFAFQQLLDDFLAGGIDILVGTQMVTKGLDFDNVTLVGILDADALINFPDFRAHERAFQLMEQVAGRAGRRERKGKVLIQTRNPGHAVLDWVLTHNYFGMYRAQIGERQPFRYPPYYRLIKITLRHRDKGRVERGMDELTDELKSILGGKRVLGPEYPMVARVKNLYHKQVLLKLEREGNIAAAKKAILDCCEEFLSRQKLTGRSMVIDVDPR